MLKYACQALSGKGPKLEEACEALSGKQGVDDKDVYLPLVTGGATPGSSGAYVRHLGPDPSAVEAEPVSDWLRSTQDLEALALPPPVTIEIKVPTGNVETGQVIMVNGPDGPIRVKLPQDAVPGTTLRCVLAPRPEYRIEVPAGASPGWVIKFVKNDGEEVAVEVPPGLQPGDTFEVNPPALMVRVPEQARPGDFVLFRRQVPEKDGDKVTKVRAEFFRAQIPQGVQPCDFFTALIPKARQPASI